MKRTHTIFLAEDDDEDIFLFKAALKELDANPELFIASNGMEMLDLVMNFPKTPSLILLDVNMPKKDGLTCLGEIKEIKKIEKVPVIIFSTHSDEEIVEKAYDLGAKFYIQKPHSFSDLVSAAHFCLSVDACQSDKTSRKDFFIQFKNISGKNSQK